MPRGSAKKSRIVKTRVREYSEPQVVGGLELTAWRQRKNNIPRRAFIPEEHSEQSDEPIDARHLFEGKEGSGDVRTYSQGELALQMLES